MSTYVLAIVLLFALSVPLTWHPTIPDFAQDYAAAWGVLHGYQAQTPTAHLLLACCPTVQPYDFVMQTAHPPPATMLSMPFALLPWHLARWAWLLVGWLVIGGSWWLLRLSPLVCLATLPLWGLALATGALEPVLFGLLTLAIVYEKRPGVAGVALGAAIALKIYPVLLVLALVLDRRWRTVIWAALAAGSLWLVAEWVTAATLPWLAYIPINTARWINVSFNYSLVRTLHSIMPMLPITISAILIGGMLIIPLLPRIRSGDVRVLVPVMLLASPLFWSPYVGLLSLHPLGKLECLCMFVCGMVLWCVGNTLIAPDGLAPLVAGLTLIAVLLAWYRDVKARHTSAKPALANESAMQP